MIINNNHMNLIDQKSQAGLCFVVSSSDLAGTLGTEVSRILLRNPANSKKYFKIYKIEEETNSTSGNSMFRYYKLPIITTVGTVLTSSNLKLDGNSSIMETYLNPTISANGTKMMTSVTGPLITLIRMEPFIWIIPPGLDLLVNVRTDSATTTWCINIYWVEE